MKSSAIGRRYASALLQLAAENKQVPKVGREIAAFAAAWSENSELREVFQSTNNDGAFDIDEPYTFRRVDCE